MLFWEVKMMLNFKGWQVDERERTDVSGSVGSFLQAKGNRLSLGSNSTLNIWTWLKHLSLSQSVSLSSYHCLIPDSTGIQQDWRAVVPTHNSATWGGVGGVGGRPQDPPTWVPFPHSGSYPGISRLKFSHPQDLALHPAKPLPVVLYLEELTLDEKQMTQVQEERGGSTVESHHCSPNLPRLPWPECVIGEAVAGDLELLLCAWEACREWMPAGEQAGSRLRGRLIPGPLQAWSHVIFPATLWGLHRKETKPMEVTLLAQSHRVLRS